MSSNVGEIQTGRFQVPFRIYGKSGPFIVCVNGAAQTMAAWRSVISKVSKDARIVTFDFPGQGRGEILSGDYFVDIDEQVGVMRDVINHACGDEQINIVSASWGGLIAVSYAIAYPDKILRMILGSFSIKISRKLLDMLKEVKQRTAGGDKGFGGELIVETFGNQIPEIYRRQIKEQFRNMEEEKRQAVMAHAFFFETIHEKGDQIDFSKINADTLIINGANDTIIVPGEAFNICRKMPHCRVEIIPDVGHFLFFEQRDLIDKYKAFILRNLEQCREFHLDGPHG